MSASNAIEIETGRFFRQTRNTLLEPHHAALMEALRDNKPNHGRSHEWDMAVSNIPDQSLAVFDEPTLRFGDAELDVEDHLTLFKPWRKGPMQIGRTFVDTEWRSDWKWARIEPHLADLPGRNVLDIGCGNGYHLFRMLGSGVRLALGVDPTLLFNYQFSLLQRLAPENSAFLLPLRAEHLPPFDCFDTVFSLGVFYHRRSPLDHLAELASFLQPGGELVLETLVIEGDSNTLLMPDDRYAKMANVWFIPSTGMLETMLVKSGFTNVRTVDVTTTTTDEQRGTRWMDFQSLPDFLDPSDSTRTVEGYPAPVRATLVANKP